MAATESTPFGAVLKRLRLAAGLTQERLAERAGLSAKAVSDLERDPTRAPRLETVTLLAEALRLEPEGRANLLAAARPESAAITPDTPSGAGTTAPLASALRLLPRPLTPLVGRDADVAAVVALLAQGEVRLLTLTGPGGVGKTRLAVAAAERGADLFADGVVFVDLAPSRDPDLVLPTIARALDVRESGATPLRERLIQYLRAKSLLLLLDNCEQVLAARWVALDLLAACPRVVVLATSREPLRVRGERVQVVAPLAAPEVDGALTPEDVGRSPAVALYLERAQAAGATLMPTVETAPALARLSQRLDGLPLAIELAATWASLLSPAALLSRMDGAHPSTPWQASARAPHDVPERQRTMHDAIAWSYDLLDVEERALFRRLCVFAGGCTLGAAEAVCAEEGAEHGPAVLHGLAALVDKNLVRGLVADGTPDGELRLGLLETIRAFGLERLAAEGEAEARGWRGWNAKETICAPRCAGR